MKQPLFFTLVLSAALSACGQQEQPAPATPTEQSATEPAQPVRQTHRGNRLGKDEINQIKASGRTGLWADPSDACAAGPRQRTALTWNVTTSGASKVVVYIVDKHGKERNFGHGGAIGRRLTGPWARPGTVFKIRNVDGKSELGNVKIGEKKC